MSGTQSLSWRVWHRELAAIVNGDIRGIRQRVMAEFGRNFAFDRLASSVSTGFTWPTSEPDQTNQHKSSPELVSVEPYSGECEAVQRVRDDLSKLIPSQILACIVHGSIGSEELVAYSDFDGLLILSDEVIKDPSKLSTVAAVTSASRRRMYEHDPLQHHGWFVLPESALNAWPQDYLPIETLRLSRAISISSPLEMRISVLRDVAAMQLGFKSIAKSIECELDSMAHQSSLYQLKSTLSKIMLLPCLFLQAKTGLGVDKKLSFNLAQRELSTSNWRAIETATAIRAAWHTPKYRPSLFVTRPGLIGDLVRKRLSPAVPADMLQQVGDDFAAATRLLIGEMRSVLSSSHSSGI